MSNSSTSLKPIDTPVFNYWNALYRSFYSRQLYIDVGKRWRGIGLLYLLLVLALFAIPFSFVVGKSFNRTFDQQIVQPLLKMPTLFVQNGVLSIDKPMPYLIRNDKNQVILAIDTTGKINDFTNEYPYLTILINKDKMVFKLPTLELLNLSNEPGSRGYPFPQRFGKNTNGVFDGKQYLESQSVSSIRYVSQFMSYPVVVFAMYSFFLVMFPVIGLLAQVFSRVFFSFQINYLTATRVLIVSSTPMLLVLFGLLTYQALFPGMGFVLLAFSAAYLGFALITLKHVSLQVANV